MVYFEDMFEFTFEDFQEFVKNNIRKCLPDEYKNAQVDIVVVKKNNGLKQQALIIKAEDQLITPSIYLEEFYKQYKNDTDIKIIMENIVDVYMHNLDPGMDVENLGNNFQDFDWVKDKIIMVAAGMENNQELLHDMPFIQKEDIALFFRVLINTPETQSGTINVQNEHLKLWDVDVDKIYEYAKKNTKELCPPMVKRLSEILKDCYIDDGMSEAEAEEIAHEDGPENNPLWVVSNEKKLYGAAVLFYEDVLYDLAEKLDSDLYILPSSIHEVIAVKTSMIDLAYAEEMVLDVNRIAVKKDEILTNNVYLYDRKARDWTLANKSIEVSCSISEEDKKYITRLATDIYVSTEPDNITLDEFVDKAIENANRKGSSVAVAELKDQERSLKERCITLEK